MCGDEEFALAHNGIICNDKKLRRELRLPSTIIVPTAILQCS